MYSIIRGFNSLRQLSFKSINFNEILLKNNWTRIAFESTVSQNADIDWRQSEGYQKDLPDPNLANPYRKAKRQCILCKYEIEVDYKNVQLLSQFVSPFTGRLYDKHITGLCEKQQKVVQREHIKAMRYSLISAAYRDPKYHNDPKLFDPTRPERPNPY